MNNIKLKEIIISTALPLLVNTFGKNLKSVIVYGSAASGNQDKNSDINLLVLLETASPPSIIKLGKEGRKIIKKYKITPLVLTVDEFLDSSDVFPMEYNDILDNHEIVYGSGIILEKLELSGKNLRHQLEERLRGLVNQIRQMLIASAGRPALAKEGVKGLSSILTAVFRSALRLKNASSGNIDRIEIFNKVNETYGTDFSGSLEITECRGKEIFPAVEKLLISLNQLTAEIDRMEIADE